MLRDLMSAGDPDLGGIPTRVRKRISKIVDEAGPNTLLRLAYECLGPDDPDVKFLMGHGLRKQQKQSN